MAGKGKKEFSKFINLIFETEVLRDFFTEMGVFVNDYPGQRSLTNRLWKSLGYDDSLTWKYTWTELLHPEDRKRVEAGLNDMRSGKIDLYHDVYRIKDPSGGWRWISSRGGVLERNKDGSPRYFIGNDDDLTRIKEAQEEASARAREVGTLNATIEVITSSLDLDETVRLVLEQARRVVPYDRATVQLLHEGRLVVLGGKGFSDNESQKGLSFPSPEEIIDQIL